MPPEAIETSRILDSKKKKDEREGGRKKEIYLPSLFMFDELIQITQDYWGF